MTPTATTAAAAAAASGLQDLYARGVPLERHVGVVGRVDQHPVAQLRQDALHAGVGVEEHLIVDDAVVVLQLRHQPGPAERALVRVELARALADLLYLLLLLLLQSGCTLLQNSSQIERSFLRLCLETISSS